MKEVYFRVPDNSVICGYRLAHVTVPETVGEAVEKIKGMQSYLNYPFKAGEQPTNEYLGEQAAFDRMVNNLPAKIRNSAGVKRALGEE
jgi:hypothetical protein